MQSSGQEIVSSRLLPQHCGHIIWLSAGQFRRARRLSHSVHFSMEVYSPSYHRSMARLDLYLKVEIDLSEGEKPQKLASEICRMIRKVYGVRDAEVTNFITSEE